AGGEPLRAEHHRGPARADRPEAREQGLHPPGLHVVGGGAGPGAAGRVPVRLHAAGGGDAGAFRGGRDARGGVHASPFGVAGSGPLAARAGSGRRATGFGATSGAGATSRTAGSPGRRHVRGGGQGARSVSRRPRAARSRRSLMTARSLALASIMTSKGRSARRARKSAKVQGSTKSACCRRSGGSTRVTPPRLTVR